MPPSPGDSADLQNISVDILDAFLAMDDGASLNERSFSGLYSELAHSGAIGTSDGGSVNGSVNGSQQQ